jgi:hypothetical protein
MQSATETKPLTKITLSDSERALCRRRPDKTVYVAVIPFTGVRGGKYCPLRTSACLTPDLAIQEANEIAGRRYKNNVRPSMANVSLYALDQIGRVTEDLSEAVR